MNDVLSKTRLISNMQYTLNIFSDFGLCALN